MAQFKGLDLALNGLKTIAYYQLESICRADVNNLWLKSLTSLDTKQASILAESNADAIYLDGLKQISDSVALMLSRGRFIVLSLSGLDSISDGAARALGSFHSQNDYARAYDSLLKACLNTDSVIYLLGKIGRVEGDMMAESFWTDLLKFLTVRRPLFQITGGSTFSSGTLKSLSEFQAKAFAEFIGADICFGNLDDSSKAMFEKYRADYRKRLGGTR